MRYWNARALAFFRGQHFQANLCQDMVIQFFRSQVPPTEEPGPEHMRAFQKLSRYEGFPGKQYPHESAAAPWRLFISTMARETKEAAQAAMHRGKFNSTNIADDVAAVYIRCDFDIVGQNGEKGPYQYGLLPHRFVGQQLPTGISKVVLLWGKRPLKTKRSNLCPKVIEDFQRYLISRNLAVEVTEPGVDTLESDWVQLSRFRTVFSWPSTFSFTALLGNPHRVFFPFNAAKMLIVEPPQGMLEACKTPHPQWSWVETDFLPSTFLKGMGWKAIRDYLNSEFCDPAVVHCIPARTSC